MSRRCQSSARRLHAASRALSIEKFASPGRPASAILRRRSSIRRAVVEERVAGSGGPPRPSDGVDLLEVAADRPRRRARAGGARGERSRRPASARSWLMWRVHAGERELDRQRCPGIRTAARPAASRPSTRQQAGGQVASAASRKIVPRSRTSRSSVKAGVLERPVASTRSRRTSSVTRRSTSRNTRARPRRGSAPPRTLVHLGDDAPDLSQSLVVIATGITARGAAAADTLGP